MKFNKMTDEEIMESGFVPDGTYDFTVIQHKDSLSKLKQTPKIDLTLEIYDNSGKRRIVFDSLFEAMKYKYLHFCQAVDLMEEYNAEDIPEGSSIGRKGKCKIVIKTDQYGTKNEVKDYLKPVSYENNSPIVKNQPPSDFVDDKDIPF